MVPEVAPLAKVTLIEAGGQVEKYPADEAPCPTCAVITVVPGCSAVIWLVSVLIEATAAVPTLYVSEPIVAVQSGTEARLWPEASGQARLGEAARVIEDGAHSSCWAL